MKLFHINIARDERGFTLVELLVVIAILGFIMAALSATVISIMRLSPQGRNWAVALRQTENAGFYISRDVQSARLIDDLTEPDQFLVLTVPEWNAGEEKTVDKKVVYVFDDMDEDMPNMPAGVKKLMRVYDYPDGPQMMVAEYIDPADSAVTPPDNPEERKLVITITAKITSPIFNDEINVTREYEAEQRVPLLYSEE